MTDLERRRPLERRSRQVKAPRPDAAVSPSAAAGLTGPQAEILHAYVADLRCTRRVGYRGRCHREVTATLFEIQFSRPCPLCRTCGECRGNCAQGLVEHGIAPGVVWPELGS
jgi:hypothetical protein